MVALASCKTYDEVEQWKRQMLDLYSYPKEGPGWAEKWREYQRSIDRSGEEYYRDFVCPCTDLDEAVMPGLSAVSECRKCGRVFRDDF